MSSLLSVRIGDARVALPAAAVREIVRAVAITPVPGAPPVIEGVVNVRGQPVAVVDLRRRLALPPRVLSPDEFLVVVTLGARVVAVRVDDVEDLLESPDDAFDASALSPTLQGLAGIGARADGALVIYDPASFVSQAEGEAIDATLPALR